MLSDEKILEMIAEGETFCDHENSVFFDSRLGRYIAMCSRCMASGGWRCSPMRSSRILQDELEANIKRYKELKEKNMTSDYRRGVEDATKPLISWTDVSDRINEIFKQRRKDLLTQKVTKWVIVLKGTDREDESIFQGRLFDEKQAAERHRLLHFDTKRTLGIYPIEIEIPV